LLVQQFHTEKTNLILAFGTDLIAAAQSVVVEDVVSAQVSIGGGGITPMLIGVIVAASGHMMSGGGNTHLVGPMMKATEVKMGGNILEHVPEMAHYGGSTTGLAAHLDCDAVGHFV
jgi:hypothetical protein